MALALARAAQRVGIGLTLLPTLYMRAGFGEAALATLAFTFQSYFDFSGYSDVALGVALALGFVLPANFEAPYRAASLQDFWRRWHITLSSWLRDYLYIPLGGNRGGRLLTYRNIMLTMTLGGLWHGASVTFVIWGVLHGVALVIERMLGITGERDARRASPGATW